MTETELAKRVGKTVSEAESKIMEGTNIYQYGGFKPKNEREKLKSALERDAEAKELKAAEEAKQAEHQASGTVE